MVKVTVIWKSDSFDVDLDPSAGVDKLKAELLQLTGVPLERQKIMSKSKGLWKGMLKDSEDLTKFDWADGMKLSLLGSSEGVPVKATDSVVFVEDMTAKDQQALGKILPPGLENLGNTCYMNSTLQCLKQIPELRKTLSEMDVSSITGNGKQMTRALRDLFDEMDNQNSAVTPSVYVQMMRRTFPQFAQLMPKTASYSQQDADEFFNALVSELSRHLKKRVEDVEFGNADNAIDALFGIETETELSCLETNDEPVVRGHERLRRLQCKIDDKVRTMEQGISLSFEGTLEKNSDVLNRNAQWKIQQRISQLPLYIVVQFNRFYWKLTPESRDHAGVSCKIGKPVKFPLEFDVFEFCTDEIKAVMQPARDRHTQKLMDLTKGTSELVKEDSHMETDDPELKEALALSQSLNGKTVGPGISANFRGMYELFGVVTHKGRSSDSGHYMGWVKQGSDSWLCFDDDHPSECKDEDIKKLAGDTPDWHLAYMAYYRVAID